jgi:bifunctional UDP-N-acetylglucosamine pyrophosphorylase/glucosamine-1-phosphate N-acetyltransferase
MPQISALILAAGKGVRMKSALPKVLHSVGGIPMLARVLTTVNSLRPTSVGVVVGHRADLIRKSLASSPGKPAVFTQPVLNGSGGAVRAALSWVRRQRGAIVVTCGDTPLLRAETLKDLLKSHIRNRNVATVLTTEVPVPFGYGRIVRGFDGRVQRIVEELDASVEERRIQEINTGTYVFDGRTLARILPRLKPNNQKHEYYLTDVLEILNQEGGRVGAHVSDDREESQGVNSRADLASAEATFRRRILKSHMDNGVTLLDPDTTYIDEFVKIAPDTIIFPQTFIKGATVIGSGCQVGPWAFIDGCIFKNDVIFRASFAESSVLESGSRVGPYSRVRPGSVVGKNAHLGNFSEVKNSRIGEGSKANHLSYLGDAILGKNVNIGAGTITCNYDGIKKSPTSIQDQAFIGSNVNLIAPVRIGAHAVVGAGSSVSRDVPAWALAVERAPVVVIKNWAKKKFKKRTKAS